MKKVIYSETVLILKNTMCPALMIASNSSLNLKTSRGDILIPMSFKSGTESLWHKIQMRSSHPSSQTLHIRYYLWFWRGGWLWRRPEACPSRDREDRQGVTSSSFSGQQQTNNIYNTGPLKQTNKQTKTHRNFFLCDNHRTVLPPYSHRCEPALVDGLEGVFWRRER